MSGKTKNPSFIGELYISKENYTRLLMWSQTQKEINFVCFGKRKMIENVYRLSNISRSPQNFAMWSENEREMLVREKKRIGQNILAWGHSHPKSYHEQHPSLYDVKYIERGNVELIVFPITKEIKAWKISTTVTKTLKAAINLKII